MGATRAYRLREPIPAERLQKVVAHDFSAREACELMERCVAHAPTSEQPLLQVIHARQMSLVGDSDGVRALVRAFVARWSTEPGFSWFVGEMKAAAGPDAKAELAAAGL